MPCRRKRTGSVEWRLGFQRYPMPVSAMFENLEAGASIEEIMAWFHLTRAQIVTVLEFTARSLDARPVAADANPV
jgi:uncharacterized protein (DUF433 family)